MFELRMKHLENCFDRAKELGMNYVAIKVQLPDAEGHEIIVNGKENFDYKKKYFADTYAEDLNHKHVKGLKIVSFTIADSYEQIENDLV